MFICVVQLTQLRRYRSACSKVLLRAFFSTTGDFGIGSGSQSQSPFSIYSCRPRRKSESSDRRHRRSPPYLLVRVFVFFVRVWLLLLFACMLCFLHATSGLARSKYTTHYTRLAYCTLCALCSEYYTIIYTFFTPHILN